MNALQPRCSLRALLAALLLGCLWTSPAFPAVDEAEGLRRAKDTGIVPGQVIVRFEKGATGSQRSKARSSAGVEFTRSLRVKGAQLVRTRQRVADAIKRLEAQPGVRYAQPNYRYRALASPPNDTRFGELWGLHNTGQAIKGRSGVAGVDVNALSAWDESRGINSVIAVLDTGVDIFHPDVAPNLWRNDDPFGNGDEDGNGFEDDASGFDFVALDNDPDDFNFHGTHVAGTAAAVEHNSTGVAGVAPDAKIMAVRVLDGDGGGSSEAIGNGIAYAATEGADVINMSLGGPGAEDQFMSDGVDVALHQDAVVVAAAGNEGSDNDDPASPVVPCNLPQPNLICVASVDNDGQLSGFSNYGSTSVDVGAPGGSVLSALTDYDNLLPDSSFESGSLSPNWTTSGTANWGVENVGATGSKSATDSPNTSYANNANALMTGGSRSLSGRVGCRFDFAVRLETEGGFDFLEHFVEANGDEYPAREDRGLSGSTGGEFFPVETSLESLDGTPSLAPNFQLTSDASGVGDGALVDDVLLGCRPNTSATENDGYHYLDGTSMAAPHVAGVAALVRSADPGAPAEQVVEAIKTGVDPLGSLSGKTTAEGIANAADAIAVARTLPNPGDGGGGDGDGGDGDGGSDDVGPDDDGGSSPVMSGPGRASFAGSPRSIKVKNGRFSYTFRGGPGLRGTATFRSLKKVNVSARKKVTLAKKAFRVPANGKVTLKVKLSRRNLRILKRNKRLKLRVTVVLRNFTGLSSTATRTLTLRS